ncbi:MAG: hypothetical protein V9F03_02045 [Microthrixaceae bacterium]
MAMNVDVPRCLPVLASGGALGVEEVATVWCATGDGPELDSFLLEFHPKVAARREGGLSLRLGALDEQGCDLAVGLCVPFQGWREGQPETLGDHL